MSIIQYIRSGDTLAALIAVLSRAFVVFCCLPIHELAHAWVATKLGDTTAKYSGRLTFNPLAHLNPIGTLMIFLFGIGYANPVPVNASKFKNPRRDMALTALAGPVSNLLMGFISVCFYYVFAFVRLKSYSAVIDSIMLFFNYAAAVNVTLAVFNLFPIPPLDGSKVLAVIIPDKVYFKYLHYERYVMIALMVLLFTGILDGPIAFLSDLMMRFISIVPSLIYNLIS